MAKLFGFLRALPGAAGVSGQTATLRETAGGTSVATDTTDANGFYDFTLNGNPYGRLSVTATDGTTTRRTDSRALGMAGALSLYELAHVFTGLGDGVIAGHANTLAVAATGTRQVAVNTGAALVKGIPFVNYASSSPAAAGSANASGATRLDALVIEVTRLGQTEEGKAVLRIVEGTASEPALTQTAALWQHKLARLSLANGGASYTVTDQRQYLLAAGVTREDVKTGVARITSTADNTISSTTGADIAALNVALALDPGVVYDIVARAWLVCKTTSGVVSIAPYIDGTANMAVYLGYDQGGYSGLANWHVLAGVVGTGAAVNCGLYAKKSASGATARHATGSLLVVAYPRQ